MVVHCSTLPLVVGNTLVVDWGVIEGQTFLDLGMLAAGKGVGRAAAGMVAGKVVDMTARKARARHIVGLEVGQRQDIQSPNVQAADMREVGHRGVPMDSGQMQF